MWTDSTDYAEIKDKLNKVFHGRKQVMRFSLFLSKNRRKGLKIYNVWTIYSY